MDQMARNECIHTTYTMKMGRLRGLLTRLANFLRILLIAYCGDQMKVIVAIVLRSSNASKAGATKLVNKTAVARLPERVDIGKIGLLNKSIMLLEYMKTVTTTIAGKSNSMKSKEDETGRALSLGSKYRGQRPEDGDHCRRGESSIEIHYGKRMEACSRYFSEGRNEEAN